MAGVCGAWSEMSPWIFLGLFLISVCLPEELSLAEGLAGEHRDTAGFAASGLNLVSLCSNFTGQGAALQGPGPCEAVPWLFLFLPLGSCTAWAAQGVVAQELAPSPQCC